MNPLEHVESWLYHLGDIDPARMLDIASSGADLVVLDHADGNNNPFETADLDRMRGDNAKLMISYLSIGEAETYREYWQSEWDRNPPDFLGQENPEWQDNIKVKYWTDAWRTIIFDYLDQIIDQGFDGVYLDIIDAYYYWEDVAPRSGDFYRRKMIEFVEDLRAHANDRLADMGRVTDFAIIGQNGEDLAEYDRYLDAVDGIGKEDLYFFYRNGQPHRFDTVPDGWLTGSKELLEQAVSAGVKVMVVEYIPPQFSAQIRRDLLKEIKYLKDLGVPFYLADERDLLRPYVMISTDGVAYQSGGHGADDLAGGFWRDDMQGLRGADVLRGRDGRDHLSGGAGHDVLKGGNGADTLDGGRGRDVAVGGRGADMFVFERGDGRLRVGDFTHAQDQLDLTDFGLSGFAELKDRATVRKADLVFNLGEDQLVLKSVDLANLDAGDFLF